MVRNKVANFKYKYLQALRDQVGENQGLKDVQHNLHFSFLEFLEGLDHSLKEAFLAELSEASEYSVLLDECEDAEHICQIAFWIIYVDAENIRQVKFLGLKDADTRGCSGEVLFDLLMEVLGDFGLKIYNMVGLGTDGASAMVGEGKKLRGRVHEEAAWVYAIHCAAHRRTLL